MQNGTGQSAKPQNGQPQTADTGVNSLDMVKMDGKTASFASKENLTPSERIQREIVAAFVPTIHDILAASAPITLHNLQQNPDYPAYRTQFLSALRDQRITPAQEEQYLLTLPSVLDSADVRQVFEQIVPVQRERQILSVVTGHSSKNWQDVVAADLAKFLDAPHRGRPDYRTPVAFADLRRRFLVDIKDQASAAQLDAYIKAMDGFETKIYRVRYDYYREFEAMRREASTLSESVATLSSETLPTEDGIATSAPAANTNSLDPLMRASRLAPVSDEHRDQLLSHAVIDGDNWRQGGQDYRLSVSSLVDAGLVPKYEISIDGQAIYLSNLFVLTNDLLAAIGFIPAGGVIKVRSFYRDKTLSLWRYLPDYVRELSGEGISILGTGFDEKSTILPVLLQSALNQIERNRGILDLSATNPDFLFAGTAPVYNNRQEYREAFARNTLRGDFYREVSDAAYNADASNLIAPGRRKNAPQLISINYDSIPNFNQPIAHYSIYSNLTGQTMGEGFPSENRQMTWLFHSDYRGRCWVAHVELNSHVTSTGCRAEWLLPTDIATPLYESTLLASGYGDPSDVRTGNYISMWNNYLSKIPLLQQYSATLQSRQASAQLSGLEN